MKPWKQVLPAATVLALLVLALVARNSPVNARSTPDEIQLSYPNCTSVTNGGIGDTTTFSLAPGEGIVQPLGSPPNAATAILAMPPANNSAVRVDVSYWDPATLTPPAGQLALRSYSFPATTYSPFTDASRIDFYPPLITRALPNVAEAPPAQLVAQWRVVPGTWAGRTVSLVADDETATPAGRFLQSDGTQTPVAGPHPVFAYQLCGGDAALQNLRVVQSVMTTDVAMDKNSYEYVQKFRVPVATTVNWIEIAFATYSGVYVGTGDIRVYDAAGQVEPPVSFGAPLLDGVYGAWSQQVPGAWQTHGDLTSYPTLVPFHDYWLSVTTASSFPPFSKTLDGTESPYFKEEIGGLWVRSSQGVAASPLPNRALSFRIIGTPTGTTAVGDASPRRRGFALTAAPNPARGATAIAWSGAAGVVSLEVIDPRGRRVASAVSDAGRWSWNGAAADGAMLPAGVYFVRARDAAGHAASVRVTLVR